MMSSKTVIWLGYRQNLASKFVQVCDSVALLCVESFQQKPLEFGWSTPHRNGYTRKVLMQRMEGKLLAK